jgi:hypothetical protein
MKKFIYCVKCKDVLEIDPEAGFSGKCDICGSRRHFLTLNDSECEEYQKLLDSAIWSLIKRNPNWDTW